MTASVIIPTFNRTKELRTCLAALYSQMPGDGSVEVLVSDDGTAPKTREMLAQEFPLVRWWQGPLRGPASNRNFGASKAQGEWLLFLDDDCIPSPPYLRAYLYAFALYERSFVALEGPTVREAEPPSLLWEAPHTPNGGVLISCNFAIRKQVFVNVGQFDERYPVAAFEDTEFAERFRLSGGSVQFVPDAEVIHPLRPVHSPSRLAARWEGKAIFALDQGATPFRVLWGLPWHALRVIQSRFRGRSWSAENIRALLLFVREWLLVCWRTPGWVWKHSRHSRRQFWVRHVSLHGPAPKFGF